ncbi:hypothetical protein BV25DRAFT_1525933 [Artomyces pyxidatus]|uniref:Uncharacterized protein n=1 Tax=Artomyces pyxidatus TaxID=48021 RepID=A0ACB8TBI6_9AGAM|nr:hypothetical protein BV25DRAFT_1525933 [Artomyces pyxidatus]
MGGDRVRGKAGRARTKRWRWSCGREEREKERGEACLKGLWRALSICKLLGERRRGPRRGKYERTGALWLSEGELGVAVLVAQHTPANRRHDVTRRFDAPALCPRSGVRLSPLCTCPAASLSKASASIMHSLSLAPSASSTSLGLRCANGHDTPPARPCSSPVELHRRSHAAAPSFVAFPQFFFSLLPSVYPSCSYFSSPWIGLRTPQLRHRLVRSQRLRTYHLLFYSSAVAA